MTWRVNTRATHPESRHADHEWHSRWHGEDSSIAERPMERTNRIPRQRHMSRAAFAVTLTGFVLAAGLSVAAFAYALVGRA